MASWKPNNGAFYKALVTFRCSEHLSVNLRNLRIDALVFSKPLKNVRTLVKTDLIF